MKFAADNLHGLNPVVIDALKRLDPKPIKELVKRFESAGVDFIDINPGHLSKRDENKMAFLVETVQSLTNLRLILDSPNPRLLEIGLGVAKDNPILSALSLEPGKLEGILPLAKSRNSELVILLMDEKSFTPPTVDEKISLAIELRSICIDYGIDSDKLIFDPVLPNMTWPDAMVRIGEVVKTVRLLSSGAVFQEHAKTMCGLSNIRSGIKNLYPENLEALTMASLAGAGIDVVLANSLNKNITNTAMTLNMIAL